MSTIVSAIININMDTRPDIDLKTFYEHGKKLLLSSTPKIIFCDKKVYDFVSQQDFDPSCTDLVLFEYVNFLQPYVDRITQFRVETDNPGKDTLDYILLMCHKTEFLKKAIERNTFGTRHFVWVDFSIHKLMKNRTASFIAALDKLKYWTSEKPEVSQQTFGLADQNLKDFAQFPGREHNQNLKDSAQQCFALRDESYERQRNRIRTGRIWDPDTNLQNPERIYTHVQWFFAGSVIGGHQDALLNFSKLFEKKCIDIINERKSIMWEVNIWYLLYKDNKNLFDTYLSNHDMSVISNFVG